MRAGCCPFAGRLLIVAILVAGLGFVAGCGCGDCGQKSANTSAVAASTAESPTCCSGETATECCKEKCSECANEEKAATEKAGDCEKCPLCSAKNGKKGDEQVALADNAKGDAKVPAALNFTMKTLDGKPVNLAKYQGKVVVFVNVASKCGYAKQYKGLQELHAKYADKGLALVGVPANEFGKQEPGTSEEIAEFCEKNYGVKFDMLEKVVVKGPGQHELYQYFTAKDGKFPGDIKWNFEKFVVGRDGEVVARFESKVKPEDAEFVKTIETELAKK